MCITKKGWALVHKETGTGVTEKEIVVSKDDVFWIVQGGTPPHKPSSTGRVWVATSGGEWNREFFPTVFNLEWMEMDGQSGI
jgi:hypothetical protein|tara:strand:- start:606 stop:851 length:246 start_codon:yes stop_codon:yes gene_type:complete